jgi:large subunit ribosomal protein L29
MASAQELRDLSIEDLARRAGELRETVFKDRLKMKTGSLDSPAQRTGHRRDLARVLTVMTEKRRAAPAAAKTEQK